MNSAEYSRLAQARPLKAMVCKSPVGGRTGRIESDERRLIRCVAHLEVARAIRAGALKHPTALDCVDGCGKRATEYDHRDYTQPLKVDAVCRGCNAKRGAALVWTADGRLPRRHFKTDAEAT